MATTDIFGDRQYELIKQGAEAVRYFISPHTLISPLNSFPPLRLNYCSPTLFMTLIKFSLITQRIYRTSHDSKPCLAKERFSKAYRIPELDLKLRKSQINAESRALEKMKKAGCHVPELFHVDKENYIIFMEELQGITVRDYLISLGDLTAPENKIAIDNIALRIGLSISGIHHSRMMHGDLTTSNMIIPHPPADVSTPYLPDKVYLIDFGLSFVSDLVEDRSVDFYVMERAIQTTHAHSDYLIHMIYNTYKNENRLGTFLFFIFI